MLAPLFWPREAHSVPRLLQSTLVPVIAGVAVAAAWWVLRGTPPSLARLAPACVIALLALAVAHQAAALIEHAVRRLGAPPAIGREWSFWSVTALLWLLAGTPLWLGPVADLAARTHTGAPTAILAVSPLVHLATASGYDLLRSQWFYGHSSLGALQVQYAGITTLLLGYAAALAALTLLMIPFGRRPKDTSVVESRIAQEERST
jgi:hypothetical protein